MPYAIKQVEVWALDVVNRPGMLARVLEALSLAGAELEFLIARRVSARTSRIFLAPLADARQRRAASDVGLNRASGVHAVRIEGPDRPGLGAELTRAIAARGINLRGVSVAAVAKKALFYLSFESDSAAKEAVKVIRKALAKKSR